MAKIPVKESPQLSRFGVLVAQLESIVVSAAHKPPDGLLCFDLLSDLISVVEEEPKQSILLSQRKCEDTLFSLLVFGARRPVRHLASVAMAKIILKGDTISIYSRASSLQGFLSEGKKNEAQKVAGAVQCLGELYFYFGRQIQSGMLETVSIVAKLLRFTEDFVRQEALHMLRSALEGSEGNAASAVYVDALRVIMRVGVVDKSTSVRLAAARCLKVLANVGWPGLGIVDLENCLSCCLKAFEDPDKSVRDAFTEALGALLAFGMNPDAQMHSRGKGPAASKKFEGGLQKYLLAPFSKAGGIHLKDIRVGIALSWVSFLQTMCLRYHHPDSELQSYSLEVMNMLCADAFIDAQALACVLYIMRVGMVDQMSEPTQRSFLIFLTKQLQSVDSTPSMKVAVLRTLSYVLKTLGEVPHELKNAIDDTIVAAVSHHIPLVRVEAALTLRILAEVDPSCIGGLISYAGSMLNASREIVLFEKGSDFNRELDALSGQAAVLAALVSVSHKLPLGYPSSLPKSMVEVCRSLLMEPSRNPVAASVEKESGWNILSSLLASMPKEEFHDQVFDILALWASVFKGSPEQDINRAHDLASEICVWSAAVDALTSYMKCFLSSDFQNRRILLQPVLLYLSRALSYVSQLAAREEAGVKSSTNLFVFRVLLAYQTLSDPSLYRGDHARIIQICTTPFREASKCDESSCLRILLDKRDAWLGPWVPGSLCLTLIHEILKPETLSKMLVNQMLLFFGTIFACQDSSGMLSLIGIVNECLKAGKKQAWHASSVTNICVGLLAGLKSLVAQRPEPLELEILAAAQTIFQSILAEGDINASQRRASSEGLGILVRLGNDNYTARLTKQFLVDVSGTVDSHYAGSIALVVGCIHRSAGGIALSSLVPNTVNVITSLATSSAPSVQVWALHGLLLTIESAGLSYVSHVQSTLSLILEIILSEESGLVDLQQAVGRLINAIVAVIGPELSPSSIFFSRCKAAIAEISSCQETATLLESVRFTQQLVLFAPHAVSVHSHLQTLLPTLSSRQPTLRHTALSTLWHLIERDPFSIIGEQIEENLFHMLDEETDAEIGNLARATIKRLLHSSCPSRLSHWLSICRSMIVFASKYKNKGKDMLNDSSSSSHGQKRLNFEEDDENMVSTKSSPTPTSDDKHLRYRTRVFAAECLNQVPLAVGENPAHFDLLLARAHPAMDWLVLQLQEIISLAYQVSTIQFEKMRPLGVSLLCTIMDKFEAAADPELPDHLLLEQYQAQLVSAIRSALESFSDPILLEAGLQLATKMLISGIISQDQAAVKRIFSLISRPLEDFNNLYYPSYAEWVSCKVKLRLLMAHASLKCYSVAFSRRQGVENSDKGVALVPMFAKSSSCLGKYWLSFLKDLCIICFNIHVENWKPFIDGIQASVSLVQLQPFLEEAWPTILQALVLDAVCRDPDPKISSPSGRLENNPATGFGTVEIQIDDFKFLWGFLLLLLFQEREAALHGQIVPFSNLKPSFSSNYTHVDSFSFSPKFSNIFFPVLQFLSSENVFRSGFLTPDACKELLQVFLCLISSEGTWDCLAVLFLSQVVENCPKDFLEEEHFACLVTELCFAYLFKFLFSNPHAPDWGETVFIALTATSTLLNRLETQMQLKLLLPFLLVGYKCLEEAPTEMALLKVKDFVQSIVSSLRSLVTTQRSSGDITHLLSVIPACLNATVSLTAAWISMIHQVKKDSRLRKILLLKLAISVEQLPLYANLAFEFEGSGISQENSGLFTKVLHLSIQCVRDVLSDSDRQIQLIALQLIRVMLQKELGSEFNPFLVFYVGELVEDYFLIMQNLSKSPSDREAVLVTGECLKILMFLQTFTVGSVCQKGLIHLLLEAFLMVLPSSDGTLSQDSTDLQKLAVKLVSQLAQSPSSAACIKEILIEMPVQKRQQLQEMIRGTVSQGNDTRPVLPSGPPLVIKLPSETTELNEENKIPIEGPLKGKNSGTDEVEEEEEEDDDWDTFQSFAPATNDTVAATPEVASISDHDFQEGSYEGDSSPPDSENNQAIEAIDADNQKETHHEPDDGSSSSQQPDEIVYDQADEDSSTGIRMDVRKYGTEEDDTLDDNSTKSEMLSNKQASPSSQLTDHDELSSTHTRPEEEHKNIT